MVLKCPKQIKINMSFADCDYKGSRGTRSSLTNHHSCDEHLYLQQSCYTNRP